MNKSQIEKLKVMAERGGTVHERNSAKKILQGIVPKQEIAPIKTPKWYGDGIARVEGGSPILSSQITHFLNNITENRPFSYKDVPYTSLFGSGHFYGVINFLKDHNLITKMGGQYTLKSKSKVREAWNRLMDVAKV